VRTEYPEPGILLVELLLDNQWVADVTVKLRWGDVRMSAMQQPPSNHQSETFGSGRTQVFHCEALPAGHPEIQARERAPQ
jgi:hypothetical protein